MVTTEHGASTAEAPSDSDVLAACWECYPALLEQAEGYIRQYVRKPRHTDPAYFGVERTSDTGMAPMSEAHDLVHSLYVQVIPLLPGRKIEGDVLPYMRRALKYHWFAVSRKGNKRPRATEYESLPEGLPQRETVSALVREVQQEARKAVVREALDQLPKRERIAVTLFHVGNWPRQRIAQELGVSVRTVGRYLRSGESRLCHVLLPVVERGG